MPSDQVWVPLDAVVSDILDRRGVTPIKLGGDFCSSGHRVISAKVIKAGRVQLDADEARYVDAMIYKKWMKTPLQRNDVIMTSEAPLGELAFIGEDVDWVLGQRLFAIRPIASIMNGRFLYYALKDPRVFADILGRASGTTVQGIRQSELRQVKVPVPALSTQLEVAKLLGTLDDQIDALRETNITLEAIAQAVFKSWFIDFDPVHTKANGLTPESIDEDTAALFPNEFEESVFGLIPKGWKIKRLGELLELAYGKALKAEERRGGDVPVYGSGGISGHHDVALVPHGSIIVGRKGTVGSLYWEDRPFYPIDTTFYVKPQLAPMTFCFYAMQRLGLEKMNTDAAVPGLNRENAYRLNVALPPVNVMAAFDAIASTIRVGIRSNSEEVETLMQLRDSLIPRLISGKLRIPEAEELIEAIAA